MKLVGSNFAAEMLVISHQLTGQKAGNRSETYREQMALKVVYIQVESNRNSKTCVEQIPKYNAQASQASQARPSEPSEDLLQPVCRLP